MKNKFFILCSHFFFLFFPSFSFLCLSPHCLSISSFFLHRPTDPSFFLRDPSPICTSPATTNPSPPTWPISASLLYFRHFGFVFRAVLVFRLCVSSCACVSGLFVFRICVSGWVFVSGMGFGFCFRLGLCFGLWFFCFLFFSSSLVLMGMAGCGCAMIFMGLMVVVVVCWWLNEILFYCSVYIILLC